jgi:hypothetical protein
MRAVNRNCPCSIDCSAQIRTSATPYLSVVNIAESC